MHETTQDAPGKGRKGRMIAFLWLLFCAGLALQAFSPHLAIEHNAFVIQASTVPSGSVIDPRALVQKQRAYQAASAALVLIGTIGLAVSYRELLAKSLFNK